MAPGKRRRSRARSISAPAKEAQKDPFAAVEKSRRESQAPRQRTPEPEPEPDDDDDVAVDAVSGATGVTDAVMLNVCTMAKEHLNSDIVTIFLYAPKKRQLWSRWGTNLPSDITTGKTRPIRVPANAGITGQAFSSQEILNVKDAFETAYFNQKVDQMTGYVTRSVLCLPLFRPYDASRPGGGAGAPPMGVVQFINKLAADDDDDDDGGDGGESDDEPADKDHALRLAEKRAVRAAVEDLEVRRDRETTEKIRVCPFAKEDLELASGFGKIASRAIATAIDHDEDRKAREEMKEANKEEEKKANFQSHVESIFDFFERRLDFGGTQVSPGGMEAAHTAFKLKQREGELSVKMNAMIRGYLTRRKVVKELKKNGMIVRSITGAAREKTDTMRAKLKDQEKIRKRAFATQQLLRRQKARDQARAAEASDDALRAEADRADAEDAREAIREAVNVAAYEKEEKFAKNFSAKKVQGMARRRSSLIMVEKQREDAVAAAARATSRRSLFRSAIRKVWRRTSRPRGAELEELQGAESVSPTPRSTPMGGRRSIAAVHEVRVKKHGRHARPPGLLSGENIYEYGWRRCQARVRGGQARRRVRLLWAEFYARIGAADDGSVGSTSFKDTYARLQRSDPPAPTPWVRGFTKFQAVARGALLRVVRRRYGAHETPFGVELEKFLPPEHGPLGATPAVAAGHAAPAVAHARRAPARARGAAPRRAAAAADGRDDGDVDFRSHRVASTAPRAVSGAYGGGGRQGRIEAQLLAELRDDLAENDVPTLGRVDEALYTATPLASRATTPYSAAKLLTSQLLSTTDEGDDESNDGRRVYVQHAYHVPIDASVSGSVPSYYPARPSGDPIYVHSPHKDRWLSAHAGVVKKSFKNDKLYREARRNVSRLVRQNRRLEYTSGLERPATTRTTSLPSPRRA
ncbi:3',5'-cyclic-nucleotide phosphodiesterase [Aureococcus anophagefferens]|nr:3',5'-cyclic-nucleotide phosphodiesterase [Aureococcus anophagefferens]